MKNTMQLISPNFVNKTNYYLCCSSLQKLNTELLEWISFTTDHFGKRIQQKQSTLSMIHDSIPVSF